MGSWFTFRIQLPDEEEHMARDILALFDAGKLEALSLRYLVLRRLLRAAAIGIVAITSIFVGTVISTILLNGVE